MDYGLNQRNSVMLFFGYALLVQPLVPLISKFLTLNSVSSVLMTAVIAGYSGLIFLIGGETMEAFKGKGREPIYGRFLSRPSFYFMTVLKAVAFFCYFQAISYLPPSLLIVIAAFSPAVIYLMRKFYRPRKIESHVGILTIIGFLSLYIVIFGLRLPDLANPSASLIGVGWAAASFIAGRFYAIEKKEAADRTGDWAGSLRFGGMHRLLVAACLLPWLNLELFIAPLYSYSPSNLALIGLALAGGTGWFVGLHVSRLFNAYYTSYSQITKMPVIAILEGLLLGIWLTGYQYLGMIGIICLLAIIYQEISGDEIQTLEQ